MKNCLALLMCSFLSVSVLLISDSHQYRLADEEYEDTIEHSYEVTFENSYEGTFEDSHDYIYDNIKWIDVGSNTLYSIDKSRATWDQAIRKCTTRGKNGRLATVDSKSTADSLLPYVKKIRENIWIGIHRNSSGSFQRIGSKQSSFFNWAVGEPNNHGNENCVQLKRMTVEFNDVKCDLRTRYLCASDKALKNETTTVDFSSESSITVTENETPGVDYNFASSVTVTENETPAEDSNSASSVTVTGVTKDCHATIICSLVFLCCSLFW